MKIRIGLAIVGCLSALVTGCKDDEPVPGTDAGTDLGVADAGSDSSTPADASTDLGTDAGHVPNWACVGSVTWPAATTETVPFTGVILDYLSNDPIADVAGTVCEERSDTACADGVATDLSSATGSITTTLNTGMADGDDGYFGYFRLEKEGYLPMIAFTYRPLSFTLPTPPTVWMFSQDAVDAATLLAGTTDDVTKGHLIVRMRDCDGVNAAGVTLTNDTPAGSTRFYAVPGGAVLSTTATETDATGVAGYINVTPGNYTLRISQGGADTGTVDVFVQAHTVTQLYLGPTPLAL